MAGGVHTVRAMQTAAMSSRNHHEAMRRARAREREEQEKKEKIQADLSQGKENYEQAQYPQAKINFSNVLQQNRENGEALLYLARIANIEKNWQLAFDYYQKAGDQTFNFNSAFRQERHECADKYIAHAEETLRAMPAVQLQTDADLKQSKAICHEMQPLLKKAYAFKNAETGDVLKQAKEQSLSIKAELLNRFIKQIHSILLSQKNRTEYKTINDLLAEIDSLKTSLTPDLTKLLNTARAEAAFREYAPIISTFNYRPVPNFPHELYSYLQESYRYKKQLTHPVPHQGCNNLLRTVDAKLYVAEEKFIKYRRDTLQDNALRQSIGTHDMQEDDERRIQEVLSAALMNEKSEENDKILLSLKPNEFEARIAAVAKTLTQYYHTKTKCCCIHTNIYQVDNRIQTEGVQAVKQAFQAS